MHESAKRLLDAAKAATKGKPQPVVDFASLGRSMGITPQRLNAWKNRGGVSKEGAIEAEKLYGCSVAWIMQGVQSSPQRGTDLAQQMGQKAPTVQPQLVLWGDFMKHETFRVAMKDDAMAPDAEAGWEVEFRRASSASPGDGVLVRLPDGEVHFRKFKQGRGNEWLAVPNDEKAYYTFESARDSAKVIAVMTYIRRPRLG